jgi:lactate permease
MHFAIIWQQRYEPLGSIAPSALVAALPVITLLALLGFLHVRAHLAALAGLTVAALVALVVYHMPAQLLLGSALYGAAFGLFPIGWIVLNAIFIYNLSVETGGFAVLQTQVGGVSTDRRIQALLIAFSFGAFIEGFAGFGAPVAITGALMIGLGFRPLEAAKLALIGNTAPVAFGSVGIPILTLAKVTGLDLHALSAMVGRQLPFFSLIVPFWLVAAQVGFRGMLGVWPACLATGASFAVVQFLVSNFHGPWLVDCLSAVASIIALLVTLQFWQPKAAAEPPSENTPASVTTKTTVTPPASTITVPTARWRAWLPWILLTAFVFLLSLPGPKTALNNLFAPSIPVPALHKAVEKIPPVVAAPEREAAEFTFNLLSATGSALFCAGVLAGLWLGWRPGQLVRLYGRTLAKVRISLLTIALMLALGFTTRYSGSDSTMGLAFATTGGLFPFFSPLLGWLGVALTGSDTSSNVLFGNLQQVAARNIGVSPILTAAANSSGGVMGKMIDAQSIVVASVATGGHPESPDAGTILRAVFWHSLALALLMGCLVMVQATLTPWVIPAPPNP